MIDTNTLSWAKQQAPEALAAYLKFVAAIPGRRESGDDLMCFVHGWNAHRSQLLARASPPLVLRRQVE
jgi:hypothetical protein